MITDEVIKEIYRKFSSPPKQISELKLDYFVELLSPFYDITISERELVINSLDEFNPFRRILVKAITAILEFDKTVAIVFKDHIIFLDKNKDNIHVHFKMIKKKWWKRLMFWEK